MSFIESLSKLESEVEVLIFSDKDITALKMLFDNSIRLGNNDMNNVTVASLHPSLWFESLYPHFNTCLNVVPKRPQYFLHTIENGEIFRRVFSAETKEFNSDEEIIKFFKEECKFKSLSIFGICKYLDVTTLKTQWYLRYNDITDITTLRDNKLESLINI